MPSEAHVEKFHKCCSLMPLQVAETFTQIDLCAGTCDASRTHTKHRFNLQKKLSISWLHNAQNDTLFLAGTKRGGWTYDNYTVRVSLGNLIISCARSPRKTVL